MEASPEVSPPVSPLPVPLDQMTTKTTTNMTALDHESPSHRDVDEKPWKYIGYKGYTEFLASENDFLVFRRFGSASTRVSLMLQHQVSVLEWKLDRLDRRYSGKAAADVNNGSFRHDEDDRAKVLEELRLKLLQYS